MQNVEVDETENKIYNNITMKWVKNNEIFLLISKIRKDYHLIKQYINDD